ncbi:WD40 repeat domain 95 [Cladochytrium tenue]|nr:WD40 repeat domain 95 [Cladochytrium tenue]
MCVNPPNTILVTGDSSGWVTAFDISLTCVDERSDITPPVVISVFRAHLRGITNVDLIESSIIITASSDGTARLFTLQGTYVGTLGQEASWDLSLPTSFSSVGKPPDVLQQDTPYLTGKFRDAARRVVDSIKRRNTELGGTDAGLAKRLEGIPHAGQNDGLQPSLLGTLSEGNPPGDDDDADDHTSARPIRTADLVGRSYQTWYARSDYARRVVSDVRRRSRRKSDHRPPVAPQTKAGGASELAGMRSVVLPRLPLMQMKSARGARVIQSLTVADIMGSLGDHDDQDGSVLTGRAMGGAAASVVARSQRRPTIVDRRVSCIGGQASRFAGSERQPSLKNRKQQ